MTHFFANPSWGSFIIALITVVVIIAVRTALSQKVDYSLNNEMKTYMDSLAYGKQDYSSFWYAAYIALVIVGWIYALGLWFSAFKVMQNGIHSFWDFVLMVFFVLLGYNLVASRKKEYS